MVCAARPMVALLMTLEETRYGESDVTEEERM